MPVEIIFGINASGKDTIAKEIKKKNSKIQITSESRLLMYHLGYISNLDSRIPINQSIYKKLENTSQNRIAKITNSVYKKTLENFKKSKIKYFLLSHLVFALTVSKDRPVYLKNREVPEWYKEVGHKFIQIVCSPEEILRRRQNDKNKGIRNRGNTDSFEKINKHQNLCNKKWKKFTSSLPKGSYTTIINNDLEIATREVTNFINK